MKESIEVRIGRYLSGESSPAEREAFEMEMESDPKLRELFRAYQKIWSHQPSIKEHVWDAEKAWSRFESIHQPQTSRNRARILNWAVAAALMLALGAAVFLWIGNRGETYTYTLENKGSIQLPDGSAVFLNKGGELLVYSFNKKQRIVKLEGEAFFEIAPNPDKPFIVKAGQTLTEVTGTAFNIKTWDDSTTIFVQNGKVIFRSAKSRDQALALTAGEAAVSQNNHLSRIINPSPNTYSWHSRELRFGKNMPFEDIVKDIALYFNKEISFENDRVRKCRMTIPLSFHEPSFDSILEAVVAPVSATYAMEGEKCVIKGGISCN